MRISSAYKLILWCVFRVCIPWILSFCHIAAARGSIKMANNEGESRHPCLVPLCNTKLGDVSPLVMTVAIGELHSVLIQLINVSPNPNVSNVANLPCQMLFQHLMR